MLSNPFASKCSLANRRGGLVYLALTLTAALTSANRAAGQQFLDQTSTRFPNPNPAEYTNQCTIGDLDGDGDLDIIWANANGFSCPVTAQLLRVYINDGSGVFTDETAARTGSLTARARGVELGDIERDGDLDIIVAQDCSQQAILLVNNGAGVFTNESATRLPSPAVLMSSSRAQFGDYDNDGDMDLFFCNGGSSRFGTGLSKIFENDGTGHFSDVTATALAGIASVTEPLDLALADVDGDYDIDFVVGARGGVSRLYKNGGHSTFTQVAYPTDGSTYSLDFGDMDGDGDLDVLGANNGTANAELLLSNNGSGVYSAFLSLPSSTTDDNDSRFIDYDNDGDLDIFVARIGGPDRAYLNTNGAGAYTLASMILPTLPTDSSLDIKVADLTGDGAYDCITAQGESGNFQNRIYVNTGPADTFPPTIVGVEGMPDTPDTIGPYVIRTLITDSMTSDRNFFDNGIFLNYTVDAGPTQTVPMRHSGGQVYRGEIPGQPGPSTVEYWVTATDFNNNTATSNTSTFLVEAPPECAGTADCCDVDANLIRDDNCTWCACDAGSCTLVPVIFGDVGGAFGDCNPDDFANLFDRGHVLTCFEDTNPCDPLNVDAGGPFGDCNPDGFCNIFDASHVLAAFGGANPCTCPSGPAPHVLARAAGAAGLAALAQPSRVRAGDTVAVHILLDGDVPDLHDYQLEVDATPAARTHGSLDLIAITIADRKDHVFAARSDRYHAFNSTKGRMLQGLEEQAGVAAPPRAYLATYTYRASSDAAGSFVVDVRRGASAQTFLVASHNGEIEITHSRAAVIVVDTSY